MSRPKAGFALYAKLVGSMALWGATWVSGRYVAQHMAPFVAAFLRFLFASAFLYVLLCREAAQTGGGRPRLPRAQWPGMALLAATGVFLYNALFFSGLKHIEAGRAAMIVACVPSTVALYAALVLRRPTGLVKGLGIGLSLFGVWIILSGGDPLMVFRQGLSLGDVFILGCVVTWAAYTIAGGRVMRQATPLSAVAWSCMMGCGLLLVPALIQGMTEQALRADWILWGNLVFLGVGATGLAFTWYYDGILALGARRASVFINLVPVFATALGALILDEGAGWPLVAGGAMVLSGVVLANRPAPAASAAAERG
jgi:drug/metabolite transporter (DMT)-like permease